MIAVIKAWGEQICRFPFLSLSQVLLLARVGTAALFGIHAVVRIINGSIPRFGEFMESVGFANGSAAVWTITFFELTASVMLMIGRMVGIATAILMAIAVGGIILIHRNFGWFVGEHGTGGMEYSFALILLLLVVAAADRKDAERL